MITLLDIITKHNNKTTYMTKHEKAPKRVATRPYKEQTTPEIGKKKSRECHNHKPQPIQDTKRKRKQTKPNKRKLNKRTKSTKINSLFPKQGNRNAKRTEKSNNKITQGKT